MIEPKRRKTFPLPQSKINRAMAILGTKTETETIEQALEMIIFGDLRGMRGARLEDVFEPGEYPPAST